MIRLRPKISTGYIKPVFSFEYALFPVIKVGIGVRLIYMGLKRLNKKDYNIPVFGDSSKGMLKSSYTFFKMFRNNNWNNSMPKIPFFKTGYPFKGGYPTLMPKSSGLFYRTTNWSQFLGRNTYAVGIGATTWGIHDFCNLKSNVHIDPYEIGFYGDYSDFYNLDEICFEMNSLTGSYSYSHKRPRVIHLNEGTIYISYNE